MLTTVISVAGSGLAILTAVLSYGMSRKAHTLSTRTSEETNPRGRSEETMRLLRWAVELAVDADERKRQAGTAILGALKNALLVVRGDRSFVHAVAEAVMEASGVVYSERKVFYYEAQPDGGGDG